MMAVKFDKSWGFLWLSWSEYIGSPSYFILTDLKKRHIYQICPWPLASHLNEFDEPVRMID